jgi:NTP pyrophosphatase (non-canonical NTP hydrolase)
MDLAELTIAVERVSQNYAAQFEITRNDDWYLLKLHEELGELTQAQLRRQGQARAKGLSPTQLDAAFRAEVADVLSHVLLLAHHHGIDVVDEVQRKWLARLTAPPRPEQGDQP